MHSPSKKPGWLDQLIKPSTRRFLHIGRRLAGYSLLDALHGYIYARWPYFYISVGTGEHRLARRYGTQLERLTRLIEKIGARGAQREQARRDGARRAQDGLALTEIRFEDTYHGKVVPLQAAKQLVMVNEPVQLTNLETIIPYARARDIILEHPDHIAVLECPCRAARAKPCLPLDVCLIVGEPFAGFILEHHPERARPVSQAEAMQILEEEDERGHVHHAFLKDAMLGRFYAICNCCACCCGAMQAQRNGTLMLTASGYLAEVDETLCQGCGTCAETCQYGALHLQADDYVMQVDQQRCMGCGVCTSKCAQGALSLRRAPEKGEPLEIFQLIEQAQRH